MEFDSECPNCLGDIEEGQCYCPRYGQHIPSKDNEGEND